MEFFLLIGAWIAWVVIKDALFPPKASTLNIEPFTVKLVKKHSDTAQPFEYYEVMGKGFLPLPVSATRNMSAVISVVDMTSGQPEPVIAAFDDFYEPDSACYYHKTDFGRVNYGTSIIKFIKLGVVLPQILVPPAKGNRKLLVVLRLINTDNPPPIKHGFSDGVHSGLFGTYEVPVDHQFESLGYTEYAANEIDVQKLTLKLGIIVAFSDGEFADEEGYVLRDWIQDQVQTTRDAKPEILKSELNETFKTYAKAGDFNIEKITTELNDISAEPQKYRAIDLCLDVMAADGLADDNELNAIRDISEKLNLDFDHIQTMKEQRLVGLSINQSSSSSMESLLGIDEGWSNEKINKHLRKQFSNWNSRINTLSDPEEKESAQQMLDMIAQLRKKYSD